VDRLILIGLARVHVMAEGFDVDAMVARFRERAQAVKDRPMPPVEGAERQRFRERAQVDFMDFAMIGDAEGALEDGVLVLRVDLRPKD
jgi:hypothetical protein